MHACLVMSNSLQSKRLQPTSLLCPWDSAGKNTGVDCHFLLQGIFPIQRWNSYLMGLLQWQVDSLPLSHMGYTQIHKNTHIYIDTHTHIYIHTQICIHMCVYTQTHIHMIYIASTWANWQNKVLHPLNQIRIAVFFCQKQRPISTQSSNKLVNK